MISVLVFLTFAFGILISKHEKGLKREVRVDSQSFEGVKEVFYELPEEKRICRYFFSGSLKTRLICENEFECVNCHVHNRFKNIVHFDDSSTKEAFRSVLDFDSSLFYHRGHTCLKIERNGYVKVGADNFLLTCCVLKGKTMLPEVGDFIEAGEIAFAVEIDEVVVPIVSPVSGEVVAVNMAAGDGESSRWFVMVKPFNLNVDLQNLLYGEEAYNWLKFEIELLRREYLKDSEFAADGGEIDLKNLNVNWKTFIKNYLLSMI